MRLRLVVLAGVLIFGGCRGGQPGNIIVAVRNLSPEAITLVTEEPGPFFFSDTVQHVIKPWTEGQCYPRLGLYPGHIKVMISGSNIDAPATFETIATSPTDGVAVNVDEDGHVQFGGDLPEDVLPCTGGGY
jgi:hypothetical protein